MGGKLNSDSIVWRTQYRINDLQIDSEHQKLFELADEAMHISKLGNDHEVKTKLVVVITKLTKSVEEHFVNEQKHMEEIDYPEIERHKFLHKNFLKMLKILISKSDDMELEEIKSSLFTFINDYFVRHIVLEDKKIHLWEASIFELKKDFGWKDTYSIGDETIDAEHKKLLDIAKEAFEEVEPILRLIKIREVLSELYTYMKTHFSHEEAYMKKIKYPQLKEHKALHDEIVERINHFVKQLPTMKESVFEKELAKIIDIALVHHIILEDKKIVDWLKSNPITK